MCIRDSLKIIDKDVSFLLMGDAGLEAESSIMATGYEEDADILKVGHHASTSGSCLLYTSRCV